MHNIEIYFDNNIDQYPFVLARHNGVVKFHKNILTFKPLPNSITLGFGDAVDSLRRLHGARPITQKRVEVIFALNIGYSKGDQQKKWCFRKEDIIGSKISNHLLATLKKYDSGQIGLEELAPLIFQNKSIIVEAVECTYSDLVEKYSNAFPTRCSWLDLEHKIDSYFLQIQFDGIAVDRVKIETLLKNLNTQKYSALLYLERNHDLDISSAYLSDEYIDNLVLQNANQSDQTEELSDLIQVLDSSDKKIDAISTVRECKIDFANLIKHYTIEEGQCIYPQYDTVASSSGRIFISSPGTQYLKKSRRDIFVTKNGFQLCYFDFRNYEPGIAAGLSADQALIDYYNTGDMYLNIATKLYGDPSFRKYVKIAMLSSLYGMSAESLIRHFGSQPRFDPKKVIDLLNSFTVFQTWKKKIVDSAVEQEEIHQAAYTRKFTKEKPWKARTSALNHVIQSTGSCILKKCILEISELPGVRILIPMHDALLCEISSNKNAATEQQIVQNMESIFHKEVGNCTSKVVVGSFGE